MACLLYGFHRGFPLIIFHTRVWYANNILGMLGGYYRCILVGTHLFCSRHDAWPPWRPWQRHLLSIAVAQITPICLFRFLNALTVQGHPYSRYGYSYLVLRAQPYTHAARHFSHKIRHFFPYIGTHTHHVVQLCKTILGTSTHTRYVYISGRMYNICNVHTDTRQEANRLNLVLLP